MSPTGKAGKPRNSAVVLKGLTQHERFVETAKALEVDESGQDFERALGVILSNEVVPKSAEKWPRKSEQRDKWKLRA